MYVCMYVYIYIYTYVCNLPLINNNPPSRASKHESELSP